MAGDWIKMRSNLWDDPRIGAIADATGSSEGPVIGAMYWLWATADQHSEDGFMPAMTLRQIDRKTGLKGFAEALVAVAWLAETEGGVTIAKFEEHNGASAKRRCTEAQRKANGRKVSAADADNSGTESGQPEDDLHRLAELEKEKRREEKSGASGETVGVPTVAGTPPAPPPAPTPPPAADATAPKGKRLDADFVLPKAWGDWALEEFKTWTADVVRLEAVKFADFWRAKSGKDATKVDWLATWRNWCRNAAPARAAAPAPQTTEQRNAEARRLLGFDQLDEEEHAAH